MRVHNPLRRAALVVVFGAAGCVPSQSGSARPGAPDAEPSEWKGPRSAEQAGASIPAAFAVPVPGPFTPARQRLLARIEQGQESALGIVVVDEGTVVWQEAIGWEDRAANRAVGLQTLFPIASVSKSLVATAASLLEREGGFQYREPSRSGVESGTRLAFGEPSPEALASHRAGIAHGWWYEEPTADSASTALLARYEQPQQVATPGTRYLYSNLGFSLLGDALAAAAGVPFDSAMQALVFQPLGMTGATASAWVGTPGAVEGLGVDGHPLGTYRIRPVAGAGLFISVSDLARYILFHASGASGSAHERWLRHQPDGFYFRGWGVVRTGVGTVFISDGQLAGGQAVVLVVPARRVGVGVMCNRTGCPALRTALEALDVLLPGSLAEIASAVDSLEQGFSRPGKLETGRYAGRAMRSEGWFEVTIQVDTPEVVRLSLGGGSVSLPTGRWEHGALVIPLSEVRWPAVRGPGSHSPAQLTLWPTVDGVGGLLSTTASTLRLPNGLPWRLELTRQ